MGLFDNFQPTYQQASSFQPYTPVQVNPGSFAQQIQQALPEYMWQGTPILDLFGVKKAYASDGGVLGSNTTPPPVNPNQLIIPPATSAPSGSSIINNNGGPGSGMTQDQWTQDQAHRAQQAAEQQRQQQEAQNQLRSGISSGWDQYLSSLNDQLNGGLQGSVTANTNIANTSYDQSVASAGLAQTQGNAQLDQSQAKSLKDIGSNISNAFQAGNNYLGSTGVGNPTGANQYAYALTKMGSQQRGDVMTNISNQKTNLSNIYNNEVARLGSEKTIRINQIADWFSQAQGQIKQQIAQGQLSKQQDINALNRDLYNQGIQMLQQVTQNAQSQQNALQTWAMNNSKSLGELQSKMQGIASSTPQVQQFSGAPAGQANSSGLFNPSVAWNDTTKKNNLFG